jgi:hypothetical protein
MSREFKEHKIEAGVKIDFEETPEVEGIIHSMKKYSGKGFNGEPNEYRVLCLKSDDGHILRVNSSAGLNDFFDEIEDGTVPAGSYVKITYKETVKLNGGRKMHTFDFFTA